MRPLFIGIVAAARLKNQPGEAIITTSHTIAVIGSRRFANVPVSSALAATGRGPSAPQLLLETGDFLLYETGDELYLE